MAPGTTSHDWTRLDDNLGTDVRTNKVTQGVDNASINSWQRSSIVVDILLFHATMPNMSCNGDA